MLKFNEELLHFVWQHRLLKPKVLNSTSGKEIRVIRTGELNADAGPDFFNAQIRIDDLVLAGNVEIHIYSSDWLKHKHQNDKNYDNLILHVVYEHDTELTQNAENNVEVLEIKDLIADETLNYYIQLNATKDKLPCAKQLASADDLVFVSWLEQMALERLENKVSVVQNLFEACVSDYTQTFFILFLRNFGFKVNALPFELLAKHISVHLLLKHSDNLLQLEALLLGMAGFLDDQYEAKYIQQLQNEFEFLKQKYKLTPLKKELFKFSKLRPANFPGLRLAQFAMLVYLNRTMFLDPHSITSYPELKSRMTISLSGYWRQHYKIDGKGLNKTLTLGNASIENLIINTITPFFFFYGKRLIKPEYCEYALALLKACECENNTKTRLFLSKRHLLKNASESQGLIQLFDKYCSVKKCLKCRIGENILRPK